MAVVRLPASGTDLLVSLSIPVASQRGGDEVDLLNVADLFYIQALIVLFFTSDWSFFSRISPDAEPTQSSK